MNFSSISLLLIVFNYLFVSNSAAINFELELLQVLFRHGDRTPLKDEIYKTDPYDPDYYQSFGYGQLVKMGKQREYKLGQMLRESYDKFLGEYHSDTIYAYSTDYDRTKMSLYLALAGLYPPTQKTSWNEEIFWSPIPTHYEKKAADFIYVDLFGRCTEYGKFISDAEKTPEIQQKMEKYGDLIEYIQNKTEISNAGSFKLFLLYSNLRGVKSMGLPLPSWCSEEVFRNLEEIAGIAFETITYTEHSKKIMAGLIIEKLIENLKSQDKRKIHMYSAHDTSISAFTRAHNLTSAPKVPSYGSAVIIEKLRGSDGRIYLRMFMWTGESEQMIPLKLDNCSNECLLEDYENFIQSMILTNNDKECFFENHPENSGHNTEEVFFKQYDDFKYSKEFLLK